MTSHSQPCPYMGLLPFDEKDRDYFFGRQRDTDVIGANFYACRLTVLYGSSGVGKTSVLRAGVVPELRDEGVAVVLFREWQPGFLDRLKQETWRAVREAAGLDLPEVDRALPFDEFVRACCQALRRPIFFIFDQFEEYFLYGGGESEAFDPEFARAVNREDAECSFLLSLREDELSKLDHFRGRIPGLLTNRIRMRHLDRPGAEAAIRRPVDRYNERLANGSGPVTMDPDLTALVLEKAMLGRTPGEEGLAAADGGEGFETSVLQLLLTRLWKHEMASSSRRLQAATFLTEMGGAENIIRDHVEEVMSELTPEQRADAAQLFRFLITSSGGKYAQHAESLAQWTGIPLERTRTLLQRLSRRRADARDDDARLLRRVAGPAERYEIYHDVLAHAIRDWRTAFLAEQEAEARREQESIAAEARLQEELRQQRERERERELEQARTLAAETDARLRAERERAVIADRSRRRTRLLAGVAGVLAMIAVLFQQVAASKATVANEQALLASSANKATRVALDDAERARERAFSDALRADSLRDRAEKSAELAIAAEAAARAARDSALQNARKVVLLNAQLASTNAELKEFQDSVQQGEQRARDSGEGNRLMSLAFKTYRAGDPDSALALFQSAEQRFRLAADVSGRLFALRELARVQRVQGRFRASDSLLNESMMRHGNAEPGESRTTMLHQAVSLSEQDRHRESDSLLTQLLDIEEKRAGTSSPEYAGLLVRMGYNATEQRLYDSAQALLREARLIHTRRRDAAGMVHTAIAFAALRNAQGRQGEAEQHLRQVLYLLEKLPDLELQTLEPLVTLGRLYRQQGRYRDAESLLTRASAAAYRSSDSLQVAHVLHELGGVYFEQGRYTEAEQELRRALRIQQHYRGDSHRQSLVAATDLALVYVEVGENERALPMLERVLNQWRRNPQTDSVELATALNNMAVVSRNLRRWPQAEEFYNESLQIQAQARGTANADYARTVNGLARVYLRQGSYVRAESLFAQALQIKRQVLPSDHPSIAVTLHDQALLYMRTGRLSQADSLFRAALRMREEVLGPDHLDVAENLEDLACLLRTSGRDAQAEPFRERAARIREQVAGGRWRTLIARPQCAPPP